MFVSTHIGGADSAAKAQAIWCSPDRVKAWENLMINGVQPAAGKCDTPTAKIMELAEKLKVSGTPALIFANGQINPGFMPAAELNKALDINK
jgi:thiol:disulfide interchange protein DsbC